MKKLGKILIILVGAYILLGLIAGFIIGALEGVSFWSQNPKNAVMWILLWPLWLIWHWAFFWS